MARSRACPVRNCSLIAAAHLLLLGFLSINSVSIDTPSKTLPSLAVLATQGAEEEEEEEQEGQSASFQLLQVQSLTDVSLAEDAEERDGEPRRRFRGSAQADRTTAYALTAVLRVPLPRNTELSVPPEEFHAWQRRNGNGSARDPATRGYTLPIAAATTSQLRDLARLECRSREVVWTVPSIPHSGENDANSAMLPGIGAHMSWSLEPLPSLGRHAGVAVGESAVGAGHDPVSNALLQKSIELTLKSANNTKNRTEFVASVVLAFRSGGRGFAPRRNGQSSFHSDDDRFEEAPSNGKSDGVFVVNPFLAALLGESGYPEQTASIIDAFATLLRENCTLRFLRPGQQQLWPARRLVLTSSAKTSPVPVSGVIGPLRQLPEKPKWCLNASLHPLCAQPLQRVNAVHVHAVATKRRNASVSNQHMLQYPEIIHSWSPVVPPMPNYCGLRQGNLTMDEVKDLRAHHENVFLEAESRSRGHGGQFPMATKIIKALLALLMPPVMDPITSQIMPKADHTISDVTGHDVDGLVPLPVVDRLSRALRYNLTNLLTASLSRTLTETLTASLTMKLGPRISSQVTRRVMPQLEGVVLQRLADAVPAQLASLLQESLSQSLPPVVTRQITRVVTHALVPTLAMALSHTPEQDQACNMCFHHRRHCDKCQYAASSQYYTNYYSDYYRCVF
eukprot:INCI13423.12.p1 GENE.INCI13423.12~~INCI13423.12.p1  ORF type:complete len:678 (+),score=83.69 INCI13423.12:221-2254(+)